jgi:hypothetical protein
MALESPIQRDGDMGFIGYASRMNPVSLPAGMLQLSENMRLDRGVATTRKGVKRLASDISVSGTPLALDFDLKPAPNEPIVRSVYSGGIFASAVMLLPEESIGTEAVVLAGPDRAYTYITDSALGVSATGAGAVLGVTEQDTLVTDTGDELWVIVLPTELTYPTVPDETIEPTDKVEMLQAYNRLYLFREADRNQPGWGTNFTTTEGILVSGTTATVHVDAHGYPIGATVRIEGGTAAAFSGHEYRVVTLVDSNRFTITVPSGTPSEAVATIQVRRTKPALYWDGTTTNDFVRVDAGVPAEGPTYKKMRSTGWASYINNRLIVPDGRQNVMISDILDPDLYDPFWASFRVGKGGNDRIMAVHPWVDNSFLVFCRKSIWLAQINQFASTDGTDFSIDTPVSRLDLLTDEVGCSARRTIATAGQYIYFLSDAGVYRLDSRLDLKLRGQTLPLSDPIADQLSDLNADLVEGSVAIYHDNRYYLAVPLAGGDTNNGVFIYNQLNEQWETQDIYGFGVDNFLVGNVEDERRLMISNRAGKLMLINEVDAGDENVNPDVATIAAVPGRIITRRYGMGNMHNKRFVRSLADVVIPNTAKISVQANTYNPDQEIVLVPGQTNTSGLAEDYTLKNPIRQKAHYAELEFATGDVVTGEPGTGVEIRNVSIEAALSSLPQTETRHAA